MAPVLSPLTFASLCAKYGKAGCSEHRLTRNLCLLLNEFRPREAGDVPPDPTLACLGPCSVCFLRAEPQGTVSTTGQRARGRDRGMQVAGPACPVRHHQLLSVS